MSERRVRITDVAPRDGLQNEPAPVPTEQKARLVRALAATGVDEVEVTSFVSARWVPQLGDASELFALLADLPSRPVFSALVPNERGMEAALEVNRRVGGTARDGARLIDRVAVFTAASETFSRRNTNAAISETIERFKPVIASAREHGLGVRGYVSCAIACPFEGPVPARRVAQVAQWLLDIGCDEIDLGDTIGAADSASLTIMLNEVIAMLGDGALERLTLHLHDTNGQAAECVRDALRLGVRSFDGAAGGLGGCPYASTPGRRAPGNIATETLVRVIHETGFTTGVDVAKLAEAGALARGLTEHAGDPGEGGAA